MANSKQFLFIFVLILFLFGLTQTHQAYSSSSNVLKDSYPWGLKQTITSPDSSTTFGFSVSLSPNISVIGDPSKAKVLVYQLEDGNWNSFQTLIESGYSSYGWSVAVSQDGLTTATGSPDNACFFPYYYDGSNYVYGWLPEEDSDPEIISEGLKGAFTFGSNMAISTYVKTQFLGASDSNFIRIVFGPYEGFDLNGVSGEGLGWAVDISENPFVAVASCLSVKKVYIYSVSRSTGFTYISDITSTLDGFGNDVAISNDGNVVVVAAMESNTVVIYRRSGNNWNEEKVLSVDSSNFGSSVSISEDGNIIVVGANLTDEVYIYSYSGSDWNEEKVLSGATSFGTDVSISGDILLVSAPQSGEVSYFNRTYIPPTPWGLKQTITSPDSSSTFGFILIYQLEDGNWNSFQTLTQSGYSSYGWSVAVSQDGLTTATGSPDNACFFPYYYDGNNYVYGWLPEEDSDSEIISEGLKGAFTFGSNMAISTYVKTQFLGASDSNFIRIVFGQYEGFDLYGVSGEGLGWAVDISENPFVAVASCLSVKKVYIYSVSRSTGFTYISDITSTLDGFGNDVAISNDGNVVVVAAMESNTVVIYRRSGNNWNEEKVFSVDSSNFGSSVSISEDGNIIVVGANLTDEVYIYSYSESDWNEEKVLSGATSFGTDVSISGDILLVSAPQSGEVSYFNRTYIPPPWELAQTITSPDSSSTFGFSVSLSPNISVIGDPSKTKVLVYQLEDGNWNSFQNITRPTYSSFGWDVSVSEDSIMLEVGAPASNGGSMGYYFDGNQYVIGYPPTDEFIYDPPINELMADPPPVGWSVATSASLKMFLIGDSEYNVIYGLTYSNFFYYTGVSGEGLGWAVDISENPSIVVASCFSVKKVYLLSASVTGFTSISDITSTLDGFGNDVAISNDGNVVVVAAMESNTVVIYRRSGNNWNEEKVLSVDSSNFGSSVSISEDGNRVVVGANLTDEVYIYSYSESDWNEEYVLSGATSFGTDVSISGDILLVSAPQSGEVSYFNRTYIPPLIPPLVELINCTSGYSEFECYWNQPENNVSLYFQIDYGNGYTQIINPVFDSSENVFYQEFNSSVYSGIYGNKEYSIQLQACNLTEDECGSPSESTTLKTMIDGVKDFELIGLSDSINVSWNIPNVEIIEEVPHLDHYVIGYLCENMKFAGYLDVDNTSTSYQITGLESGNECEVAMWGCRTPSCSGDDEGESVGDIVQVGFGPVLNLKCLVSNVLDIDCSWLAPEGSQSPSYYNITYKSYSFEDEEEYQTTQLYQNFTVKLPNQYYQINVSACSSNGVCGIISSKTIRIAEIPHPNIIESISEIEQIKLNFSQVSQAKSYLVSIDNHLTWINFTTLISNGNEMIGTINELSGNVDYYISVRGCTDTSCEPQYLGIASSTITNKPKLGNITGLNCNPTICGFECEWNGLELSNGLEKYSLSYNSESICLDKSLTNYSISDLLGGENYEISIFASADLNCSFNQYSGLSSSTSVTTNELPAPSNVQSYSEIEQIKLTFTKLSEAKSYLVSIDNQLTWINFTTLISNGNEMIGTINELSGNVDYYISVRGCTDTSCTVEYAGYPSSTITIKPKLGNITGLNCNPTICGFECEWNELELSNGLRGYSLSYNSESICLDKSLTNYSIFNLIGGENYEISIFASADLNCSFNEYSGLSSSTSVTTNMLPAPSNVQSYSEIEQIKLTFSQVSEAKSYLVSIDGKMSWINFTTLISNGNEMIGTINELSGNVDYYISVRGCTDTSCTVEYAGYPSSTITIKPKLGNITGLNCNPTICGFECEWNGLELSNGLRGYSLSYNSESICLAKSLTKFSIFNLIGGENYEISIFASADWRCETNQYSGLSSSTSITTIPSPTEEANDSSTDTKVVIPAVLVPIIVIAIIIVVIIWLRKRSKKSKNKNQNQNQEIELSNDV
ncbi:hypothetical protein M0811_06766 [Anaeramoeba ignava]|uniref:Fibronectin type-III domain-containing protein n=1 Tax=Anaeramoeba ignava TaxID=1746090 RepID=A0A9Q0LP16_ANAIG|nr:hypothetical protein M0811_06766 [Anaeramoeba ignava]